MASIPIVEKKLTLNPVKVLKLQAAVHCFVRDIKVSEGELNCIVSLALAGPTELNLFCEELTVNGVASQVTRNLLTKLEKKGLVVKSGKKKVVQVDESLALMTTSPALLSYKILSIAA